MANTASSKETAVTETTGIWVRKSRVSEFDRLLETGQFADLVVVCKDRECKLHKAIVCPRSDYFMKACGGNFSGLMRYTTDRFMAIMEKFKHWPEFASWRVAVLEEASPASPLRTRLFKLVQGNMRSFFDGRDDLYRAETASFKAAMIRCPEFAVSLMFEYFESADG
ncbi:hypothetical protein LTR95_016861 [Oleoguttula sp. CCFEE 5521]